MQNNKPTGSFKQWLRNKGYYIVLFLCVAAVGISGYLFLRTNHKQEAAQTMAVESAQTQADSQQETSAKKPAQESTAPAGQMGETAGTETSPETSSKPSPSAQSAKDARKTMNVTNPVEGDITQTYATDHLAYNATMEDWRTHDGIDITAASGTPVCAAADGTVVSIYEDDFLGNTVVLQHSGGYSTRYSSLDPESITVAVGDQVKGGDAMAAVGSSALLEVGSEPHLHFAVYCSDESINPEHFLDPA